MDELKAMIETEKGRGVIKLKKPSKRKDIVLFLALHYSSNDALG